MVNKIKTLCPVHRFYSPFTIHHSPIFRQLDLWLLGLLVEEEGAAEHLGHFGLTRRGKRFRDVEAVHDAALQDFYLDQLVAGDGLGSLLDERLVYLPFAHRDDRLETVSQPPEKPFLFSAQHDKVHSLSSIIIPPDIP